LPLIFAIKEKIAIKENFNLRQVFANSRKHQNYKNLYKHYKVDHAKAACFQNPPTRSKEDRKSRTRQKEKKKARFRNAYRESRLESCFPTMKTQHEATQCDANAGLVQQLAARRRALLPQMDALI